MGLRDGAVAFDLPAAESPQHCCTRCTPSPGRTLRRRRPGVLDGCTRWRPGAGDHELPLTRTAPDRPCPLHPVSTPSTTVVPSATRLGACAFLDAGGALALLWPMGVWTEFRPWLLDGEAWPPGHFVAGFFRRAATSNFATVAA